MSEASDAQPRGNIYDLGYRNYDGPRLGRSYAFRTLFAYSFLSIWGIGRSWLAKFFPISLAIIAMVPALIGLTVAALLPAEFELIAAHEYFSYVAIILALLCAVAAPELIGRDQRHRTLTLYFSRALSRLDYAGAKLGALAFSLFLVLAAPQVFIQIGNALATDDVLGYLRDRLDLLPPILASSVLVAFFMGAISLAIAIQTSRRAFATGAVLAAFVILAAIGGIFTETLNESLRQYALLVSPISVSEGAVYWIFGEAPMQGSELERAGLAGEYYGLAILAYIGVALAVIYRRIVRMSA